METNYITDFFQKTTTDSSSLTINILIALGLSLLLSWIIMFVFNRYIYRAIKHIAEKSSTKWDDILLEKKLFHSLSFLIPVAIFWLSFSYIEWEWKEFIQKFIGAWAIAVLGIIINNFLESINSIYETYEVSKNRPIKSLLQAIKIVIFLILVIIIISIFVGKSPVAIFGFLGAGAAVITLVFKDSIVGFVSGVQLVTNNMVKIGDWIVTPNGTADGEVIEISIYTIKVQNWDKTISSIPAYKLMSESFVNWKGMEEGGGRRIKRSINIDQTSVHFLTNEEIEFMKSSEYLKPYIEKMLSMLDAYKGNDKHGIDTTKLTNLGIFRIYLSQWLEANPDINQQMTHMVRQLQPTPAGIPIEIYCFSQRKAWIEYEVVQADLFDHILSVVSYFNLKIYQYNQVIEK